MLQSLHIHNFALIEDLQLSFGEGITILPAKPAPASLFFSMQSACWQETRFSIVRAAGHGRLRVEGAFFFLL